MQINFKVRNRWTNAVVDEFTRFIDACECVATLGGSHSYYIETL